MGYCLHFWTDNSLRMIRKWTESLSDEHHRGIEYSPSPDLLLREDPTEILPQDITALQDMMSQFLVQKREHLETWFAQEMSQTAYELPKAPEAEVYSPSQVQTLLQEGHPLHRLMGLRMLHIGDRYFVNGESLDSDHADA
nr:winged helix domain-containing protein [Candidatus Hamiltonella defensa]